MSIKGKVPQNLKILADELFKKTQLLGTSLFISFSKRVEVVFSSFPILESFLKLTTFDGAIPILSILFLSSNILREVLIKKCSFLDENENLFDYFKLSQFKEKESGISVLRYVFLKILDYLLKLIELFRKISGLTGFSDFFIIQLVLGILYSKKSSNNRVLLSQLRTNILLTYTILEITTIAYPFFTGFIIESGSRLADKVVGSNSPNSEKTTTRIRVEKEFSFYLLLTSLERISLAILLHGGSRTSSLGYFVLVLREITKFSSVFISEDYDISRVIDTYIFRSTNTLLLGARKVSVTNCEKEQSKSGLLDLKCNEEIKNRKLSIRLLKFIYILELFLKLVVVVLISREFSITYTYNLKAAGNRIVYKNSTQQINTPMIFGFVFGLYYITFVKVSNLVRVLLLNYLPDSLGGDSLFFISFLGGVIIRSAYLVLYSSFSEVFLLFYYYFSSGEFIPIDIDPVFKRGVELQKRGYQYVGTDNRNRLAETLATPLLSSAEKISKLLLLTTIFTGNSYSIYTENNSRDLIYTLALLLKKIIYN